MPVLLGNCWDWSFEFGSVGLNAFKKEITVKTVTALLAKFVACSITNLSINLIFVVVACFDGNSNFDNSTAVIEKIKTVKH